MDEDKNNLPYRPIQKIRFLLDKNITQTNAQIKTANFDLKRQISELENSENLENFDLEIIQNRLEVNFPLGVKLGESEFTFVVEIFSSSRRMMVSIFLILLGLVV